MLIRKSPKLIILLKTNSRYSRNGRFTLKYRNFKVSDFFFSSNCWNGRKKIKFFFPSSSSSSTYFDQFEKIFTLTGHIYRYTIQWSLWSIQLNRYNNLSICTLFAYLLLYPLLLLYFFGLLVDYNRCDFHYPFSMRTDPPDELKISINLGQSLCVLFL